MWRLAKSESGQRLVLVLSGHIGAEQLAELRQTVESEAEGHAVALNLENLRLVDRDVVAYLAQCERRGIRLENCPAYVREWIGNIEDGEEA
jgi:ABC-type transporter Mla MlaB component